jgi:hypothetical protein
MQPKWYAEDDKIRKEWKRALKANGSEETTTGGGKQFGHQKLKNSTTPSVLISIKSV